MSEIKNVLAERYASKEMIEIWSRENKIRLERQLWIAVMRAQSKYGVEISSQEIEKYEKAVDVIDLDSIDDRERQLRHDVKARIEEFNAIAGLQLIHLGMTSRDLTENVELLQIKKSLTLIEEQSASLLRIMAEKMAKYQDLVMVGRSHNVPAQLTTLGKRFATIAEELLFAYERLQSIIDRLPLKGLRGPVGTAQDLVDLSGSEGATAIEREIANILGFSRTLDSTGQIYPRSIDFEVISTLVQLSSAPSSFATTLRLMSGAGLASEGFKEGQVGSSAMPHKMNPRSSERINGLAVVLKGYLSMISEISGDQWNEGDVSCSVVRRVALPDAFFTLDGINQTFATILSEMQIFEESIRNEVQENLPYVSTTKLLIAAVKNGIGREYAHTIIQEHSIKAQKFDQAGKTYNFLEALASDEAFGLTMEQIKQALDMKDITLASQNQVSNVQNRINMLQGLNRNFPFKFSTIR